MQTTPELKPATSSLGLYTQLVLLERYVRSREETKDVRFEFEETRQTAEIYRPILLEAFARYGTSLSADEITALDRGGEYNDSMVALTKDKSIANMLRVFSGFCGFMGTEAGARDSRKIFSELIKCEEEDEDVSFRDMLNR